MDDFEGRVAVVTGAGGIREKALYILTHEKSRDIQRRRAARLDEAAERVIHP